MKLTTKIFLGLVAGIAVGLAFTGNPELIKTYVSPIGTLFLNLIKMVIVPLVFSSLVVGAASTGDAKTLGRIGGKTMIYFLITTAIAIVIGLGLGLLIQPGAGLIIPAGLEATQQETPSIINTFLNVIPANPLKGLVEGNMLQIITFALFIGIGLTSIPEEKGRVLLSAFDGLAEVMYKITAFVMELAPYGVFGLMAPVVASNGPAVLLPLIKVIAAVYIGCILHALIVYAPAVKIFAKINPITYFKGVAPAAITAFTTSSSAGTLPITIKSVKETFKVSDKVASFVLPLGATINMDGTALYQGVCALFITQAYGITLTMPQIITIILTSTLGSIGTAGVPGAGMIMLTIVLNSVGLPLEGIALIAGIDRVLDMARTCINVVGDTSATLVVAATENEIGLTEPSKVLS